MTSTALSIGHPGLSEPAMVRNFAGRRDGRALHALQGPVLAAVATLFMVAIAAGQDGQGTAGAWATWVGVWVFAFIALTACVGMLSGLYKFLRKAMQFVARGRGDAAMQVMAQKPYAMRDCAAPQEPLFYLYESWN